MGTQNDGAGKASDVIGANRPELEARRREAVPRVVGPGRRERSYLERIETLQVQRASDERRLARLAGELEASERVERGCQKHIDRLEKRLDDERSRTREAEAVQKRLLVALGAVQRENELLREQLAAHLSLPGVASRPAARLAGRLREPRPRP
jgi:chromosome segregation ATPase